MDLQRFCSRDEYRHGITHPFRQGGYIYATDGRILVRAKVEGDYPEQDSPDVGAANFAFDHDAIPEDGWLPVPSVRRTVCCPDCNGDRRVSEVKCEDCGGKGEIRRECDYCDDEHYCHCRRCDGTGIIELKPGNDRECVGCHGHGVIYQAKVVAVNGAHYAAIYLDLISTELPGAVIEKTCPKYNASRFRCGDVLGYLMPVRME